MPEFPPTELPPEIREDIVETRKNTEAAALHLEPISGQVQVTADDTEVTVIDTSQINIVNNKPHTLAGWMDLSAFAQLAQSKPDATIEVRWYVDGKLYKVGTYSPADFESEPILYFLERAALKYHKITIILHNTGVTSDNPLTFDYGFEIRTALRLLAWT